MTPYTLYLILLYLPKLPTLVILYLGLVADNCCFLEVLAGRGAASSVTLYLIYYTLCLPKLPTLVHVYLDVVVHNCKLLVVLARRGAWSSVSNFWLGCMYD